MTVMRLGTRAVAFIIPALLVAAFAFFTFFRPEPDEDLEYLAREDAVLVQMTEVGGLPQPELFDRLTLPAFTLYGDGTVIYTDPSEPGHSQLPHDHPLLRAEIPGKAVRDLLEFFEGTGFFDFQYEQPRSGGYDFPTTYLYAQTKEAANAVSAYALGAFEPPRESEWREFGRLAEIKKRLDTFDPEVVGGRVVGPYEVEELALMVEPIDSNGTAPPDAAPWPVNDIDLASLTPPEASTVGVRYLPLDEAADVIAALPNGFAVVRDGGAYYYAGYRPVLPFEEHFPEFDFGA